MQEDLGANVKVVNKEGGSQVVGLNYVANAKADGLTFGNTNIPSILGRYLDPAKKAAFDCTSMVCRPDSSVCTERMSVRSSPFRVSAAAQPYRDSTEPTQSSPALFVIFV